MMVAIPSKMKNAIRISVSDSAPLTGHPIRTAPAAIARTAENSDHQNPGAWRIMKVMTRPTIPLMKNSQPRMISTARVAICGTMMAAAPSAARIMPSISRKRQPSASAPVTPHAKRSMSDGLVTMAHLLCRNASAPLRVSGPPAIGHAAGRQASFSNSNCTGAPQQPPAARPGIWPKRGQRAVRVAALQICLQRAHEGRQPGLTLALEALGGEDRTDVLEGAPYIAIDDHVIVFRPVAHLIGGLGHAGANDIVGILGAGPQARFKIRNRRRQHKDADEIIAALLAQLLRALPVDVEHHITPHRQRALDRCARRAIAAPEHLGPFEKVAARHHGVEAVFIDEAVVPAFHLARTRLARRHRDRQLDGGIAIE